HDDDPRDRFGNRVPKRCRDALFDPFLQEAYRLARDVSHNLRMGRWMDAFEKRKKHYGRHLRIEDCAGAIHIAFDAMDKLAEHLRDERPGALCPGCDGEGCPFCHQTGVVSLKTYGELAGLKVEPCRECDVTGGACPHCCDTGLLVEGEPDERNAS